jgi:putative methyltransferase (TIGR04325 family)
MINLLKQITPPIFKRIVKYRFSEGWHGDYKNWAEAKKATTGYEANTVIDRVRVAALKARNGEVAYERSALTYNQRSVSFPLLAGLLYAANHNNHHLVVLDYGGSLGSIYYQLKPFLTNIPSIRWCVVEQPTFVEVGRKEFEDEQLHFFYSVEECMEVYEPTIVLFTSSLQYLEKPFEVIEDILKYEIPYLMIDRTAFIEAEEDRLTIQKVPPAYYDASYPCWFFSKQKFLRFMSSHYTLLGEFKDEMYLQLGLQQLRYEGMWFERKI